MKKYTGIRTPTGCEVRVTDGPGSYDLDPRFDLRNHSPDGFEFSYNGSGPSQLALALLADALGDEKAQRWYQSFKFKVISRLRGDSFVMSQDDIVRAVAEIEAERGRGR